MDSNSTTPGISLTPSADVQQKSRSRAGTLPSSFIHGSSPAGFNQSHSPLNAIGNSEPLGIPYMDSFTLGIPASSPPLEKEGMDIPGSNGSTRRMRSGSLFSTNSIWNDDALQHSPSQGNGPSLLDNSSVHSGSNSNGGSFFSPALGPQQYQGTVPQSFSAMHGYPPQSTLSAGAQTNRNRSYTTTGAVPVSAGMPSMASQATPLHVVDPSGQSRLSTSPFHGSLSQSNDMNVLLDNLMASMNTMHNRNRAQTFSGAPAEADAVLLKQLILAQNYLIQQEQQQEQARNQILAQQPVLQDDIDFSDFRITTNFDNPNLGPTNFLLFDNLPNFIDSIKLWSILSNSLGTRAKGSIKSLKVTTTKSSKLALVECCSVEIAMTLKANFNHLELVPGITLYAAFALVLDKSPTEQNVAKTNNSKTSPNSKGRRTESPTKSLPIDLVNIQLSLLSSVALIAPYDIDMNKVRSMIQSAIRYPNENYKANFGPLPEPIPLRQFDSPKLRELRKSLETCEKELSRPEDKREMSDADLDELAISMLDELPELCYDYLGNTVIQKLFAVIKSPAIKLIMVHEIAPYLTQLGIHKNGTWAIQKIINLCDKDYNQMNVIAESLKPYSLKMFNDQFGNYVLQGCIKFGSPFNDFIIETILDNFLEISNGRFGARCIRTMLELCGKDNAISREQVALVASLIVEYANDLIVNPNGSLLLTWFLDTFNGFDKSPDLRYKLVTDKVISNLGEFCTHKLANLTVLKILSNRSDPELSQRILNRIFGAYDINNENGVPTDLLEHLLAEGLENNAGPLFLYKIVSNPPLMSPGNDIWNDNYHQYVVSMIRRILLEINIVNVQPYRKLMDEVGLASNRLNRSGSTGGRKQKRGHRGSHGASGNLNPHYGMPTSGQYANPYIGQVPAPYNAPMSGQIPLPYGYNGVAPQNGGLQGGPDASQYQDAAVMQQLEQLSLSSAALGYNSNPGTPGVMQLNKRTLFF